MSFKHLFDRVARGAADFVEFTRCARLLGREKSTATQNDYTAPPIGEPDWNDSEASDEMSAQHSTACKAEFCSRSKLHSKYDIDAHYAPRSEELEPLPLGFSQAPKKVSTARQARVGQTMSQRNNATLSELQALAPPSMRLRLSLHNSRLPLISGTAINSNSWRHVRDAYVTTTHATSSVAFINSLKPDDQEEEEEEEAVEQRFIDYMDDNPTCGPLCEVFDPCPDTLDDVSAVKDNLRFWCLLILAAMQSSDWQATVYERPGKLTAPNEKIYVATELAKQSWWQRWQEDCINTSRNMVNRSKVLDFEFKAVHNLVETIIKAHETHAMNVPQQDSKADCKPMTCKQRLYVTAQLIKGFGVARVDVLKGDIDELIGASRAYFSRKLDNFYNNHREHIVQCTRLLLHLPSEYTRGQPFAGADTVDSAWQKSMESDESTSTHRKRKRETADDDQLEESGEHRAKRSASGSTTTTRSTTKRSSKVKRTRSSLQPLEFTDDEESQSPPALLPKYAHQQATSLDTAAGSHASQLIEGLDSFINYQGAPLDFLDHSSFHHGQAIHPATVGHDPHAFSFPPLPQTLTSPSLSVNHHDYSAGQWPPANDTSFDVNQDLSYFGSGPYHMPAIPAQPAQSYDHSRSQASPYTVGTAAGITATQDTEPVRHGRPYDFEKQWQEEGYDIDSRFMGFE